MRRRGLKKLRGGKRYYTQLRRRAATLSVDLTPGQWYDLWHQHFDWVGRSRRGGRARAEHLAALFVAFERMLAQTANANMPVQVFLSIAPESNAEEDALYVHTPNPNGTPFSNALEGVTWGVPPPPFLRVFVENERWEVGRMWEVGSTGAGRQAWWVVRPRFESVQPATASITRFRRSDASQMPDRSRS